MIVRQARSRSPIFFGIHSIHLRQSANPAPASDKTSTSSPLFLPRSSNEIFMLSSPLQVFLSAIAPLHCSWDRPHHGRPEPRATDATAAATVTARRARRLHMWVGSHVEYRPAAAVFSRLGECLNANAGRGRCVCLQSMQNALCSLPHLRRACRVSMLMAVASKPSPSIGTAVGLTVP